MNRCVYGLKEASRYWYLRIYDELSKCGCKRSKLDPAVFFFYTNRLEGLLVCHVDDFLHAGSERFEKEVILYLKSIFKVSREDAVAFRYVGVDVQQCRKGVFIGQQDYVEELKEIHIDKQRIQNKNLIANNKEKEDLRSIIGQLNWLCTQTRPDLSFSVCELSNSYKTATIATILNANKIIRKAKAVETSLFLPKVNLNNFKLICYTDAAHGNLPDGGSQAGLYLELVSENKRAPIHWQSKRVRRVVKSSMAAETLSLVEGVETAILIRKFINEILFLNQRNICIEVITDSKSVFDAAYGTNQLLDKGQRINMALLRETITLKEVELKWVPSGEQLANVLTKKDCESRTMLSRISNSM